MLPCLKKEFQGECWCLFKYNSLAMKLAYPEEMTFCFKFHVSDDLFSGLLKSSKKKQHLICYRRHPTKAEQYQNNQLIPPIEKGFV